MNCKCGHPDHAHLLDGEGRCQYWIIKSQSDWYPDKSLGKNIKAWTMDVEYECQCPCEGIGKARPKQKKIITIEDFY